MRASFRQIGAVITRLAWLLLFALSSAQSAWLDVDGDGNVSATTDGQLVLRYLFGFSGDALVGGALGDDAVRDAAAVASYLSDLGLVLDVDSDGSADALSDGVLILRRLRGDAGGALIAGAVNPGASRDAAAIGDWIDRLATGQIDDNLFTGGDGVTPDDNLRVASFQSNEASGQGAVTANFPSAITATGIPTIADLLVTPTQSRSQIRWISQFTSGCDSATENGFCGFASVLMGADYLLNGATNPPAPENVGYAGDTDDWLVASVAQAFGQQKDYANCGGPQGIEYADIPNFAREVGLVGAIQFNGLGDQPAEDWIIAALANDVPVIALVPYQSSSCSGRNGAARADYYDGGAIIREMMPCPENTWRHWVLLAEIDQDSILVYDPDPFATSSRAGIRRYSRSSFFSALPDTRPNRSGVPNMWKLCVSQEACDYAPEAFTTVASLQFAANQAYTADNTQPVATSLAPDYEFEGSGLPAGLEVDTEGRIIGETSVEGTFYPKIIMRSVTYGIERVAELVIKLVVSASNAIQQALEFTMSATLTAGQEDSYYFLPIGTTPTQEPVTFSVVGGELPIGLSLSRGAIFGVPTHPGTWSVELEAATSTTSTTKSFSLTIEPAVDDPGSGGPPVLGGVEQPLPLYGQNGQQQVLFSGSGFAEGMYMRLYDLTHGDGPYDKVAELLSPAAASIRANFTTEAAQWSATAIDAAGNESNTITFSVLASGAATRPAIWNSAWQPPLANGLEVTAEYGAFSKGCANADQSNTYTWYLDARSTTEHLGLDLSAQAGDPVRTIAPGIVLNAGNLWGDQWRGVVLVEHWTATEVFTAVYGHINVSVAPGPAIIPAGTQIGTVADLGHMHFGIAEGSHTSVPGFADNACVSSPNGTANPEEFLSNRSPSGSPPSATVRPTTPTDPAPGSLTSPGTTLGDTRVTLSWNPSDGATYYDLGVRDLSTNSLVVNQTTGSSTVTISLAGGKQYRWNVAACNLAGCSAYTAVRYFQTPSSGALAEPPSNVEPGDTTAPGPTTSTTTVTLSWSTSVGATFYDVGVRDLQTDELVLDTTTPETASTVELGAGKQYRWNVAACNAAGCVGYDITRRYFQTPQPPAGQPTISAEDVVVDEGAGYAEFVVRLSGPSAQTVAVQYDTSPASAGTSDFGYFSSNIALSFAPGETLKTVRIPVVDDTAVEGNEAFYLNLFYPSNATVGTGHVTATIVDNDAAVGTPVIAINDPVLDESAGEAVFVVSLDRPSDAAVSVTYATAPGSAGASDFTARSGSLTFAPGERVKTVRVAVLNDTLAEDAEQFDLVLSDALNATLADPRGTATIGPSDQAPVSAPVISAEDVVVDEGAGYAEFVVRLSGPSAQTVAVQYDTSPASAGTSDFGYFSSNIALSFAPGETLKTVRIPVVDDTAVEGNEAFYLNLFYPSNATVGTGHVTATIVDNDAAVGTPVIAINDPVLDESAGEAVFVVSLDRPSDAAVSVTYATAPGSAGASDFTARSGSLTFAPGERVKTVRVAVLNDTLAEDAEQFDLVLSDALNATLADPRGTATIGPSDQAPVSAPVISAEDVVVDEGAGYAEFVVRLSGPSAQTVAVQYDTSPASAGTSDFGYFSSNIALSFAPGETLKTVRIPVVDDTAVEGNEAFYLNLFYPSNATVGTGHVTATIVDNDAAVGTPVIAINDPVLDESAGEAVFVVSLDRPSDAAVSVTYATAPGSAGASDFTARSGSLTFAPGERVKTVRVAVLNDTLAEDAEQFDLVLSDALNATLADPRGTATIGPSDQAPVSAPVISAEDVVVDEGAGYAEFVVRLSGPSAQTVAVQYDTSPASAGTSDFGYFSSNIALSFAPGETLKTVRVGITDDTAVESDESFYLNLFYPSNATVGTPRVTAVIVDDD